MSTNNTLSTRSTQPEKARLGAVGENMVVSMLMQNGGMPSMRIVQ